MDRSKNIQTVQNLYSDFGKGNIQGIMDVVADNVSWNDAGYPDLPFGSENRPKNDIPNFFKTLSESVNYSRFEPQEFYADGNAVVAVGHHEGVTKPKNVHFSSPWIMLWKFNDAGKVSYVRTFIDTNEIGKGFRN